MRFRPGARALATARSVRRRLIKSYKAPTGLMCGGGVEIVLRPQVSCTNDSV